MEKHIFLIGFLEKNTVKLVQFVLIQTALCAGTWWWIFHYVHDYITQGESRAQSTTRQSLFSQRAWKCCLVLPWQTVTLRQRPRHHQCQTHLGQVSWAGPCTSARRGFPDPCTAMQLRERKKCQAFSFLVILRTLCIGGSNLLSSSVHR